LLDGDAARVELAAFELEPVSDRRGQPSVGLRITRSPVSVFKASNEICLRCTSNPATIAIRASSSFRH
jgi:hypothetical protein